MKKLVIATVVVTSFWIVTRMTLPLAWQPPLDGLGLFALILVLSDPRGSDEAVPAQNIPLKRRVLLAFCGGLSAWVVSGALLFRVWL